jgi:chromosome segregation ATPase
MKEVGSVDNQRLHEIRDKLYRLPGLEERLNRLNGRIREAENELNSLLRKYEKESLDVEQLQKESLSSALLRLLGRYDGKLDKEKQEMLEAKIQYDKAAQRVTELYKEREDLGGRINALRQEERLYEAELSRREEALRQNTTDEKAIQFSRLESEVKMLHQQLVEIDEAIAAAVRAKATAQRIIKHLDSAEGWATYDVWFKGGIITHLAKYGHIDDAEKEFNRLSSNMRDLRRELKDINMSTHHGLSGIDSTKPVRILVPPMSMQSICSFKAISLLPFCNSPT